METKTTPKLDPTYFYEDNTPRPNPYADENGDIRSDNLYRGIQWARAQEMERRKLLTKEEQERLAEVDRHWRDKTREPKSI